MKNLQDKTVNEFIASLMPDSDKKMGSIAGVSFLVALSLCFWAAAYERVIDDVIFDKLPNEELKATVSILNKKEEKKETPKQQKKNQQQEIQRKRPGGGGKTSGKGNPRAPLNRGIIKMITAQTNNASAMAYDLMKNQQFAKDIDKVLKHTNGLQTTGKTKIGEVRGKVNGGFNEGLFAGGSGGIDDAFTNLIGNAAGSIATKALKGRLTPPSPTDIDMSSANSARSASDIMKVIRTRTPGLRHVYNKYLKKNPGFQGKVTLKFTIAPGGEIVSIAIVSSTTGYEEFDNEVKNTVGRWTFNKVKSGNTTVTVPFTFSE